MSASSFVCSAVIKRGCSGSGGMITRDLSAQPYVRSCKSRLVALTVVGQQGNLNHSFAFPTFCQIFDFDAHSYKYIWHAKTAPTACLHDHHNGEMRFPSLAAPPASPMSPRHCRSVAALGRPPHSFLSSPVFSLYNVPSPFYCAQTPDGFVNELAHGNNSIKEQTRRSSKVNHYQ